MNEAKALAPEMDLVAQAQNGNAAAFESLFERFYMEVYRHAFTLVGRQEDAEDIAQETFVKVARSIADFRGDSSFRTWIWRITTNTAFDWRKMKQRYQKKLDHFQVETQKEEAKGAQGFSTSTNERSTEILSLLDRLPAKQRQAILLTYYENLSHEEAAKICGCTLNTLSWRVFMGKQKLKKYLKGFFPDERF